MKKNKNVTLTERQISAILELANIAMISFSEALRRILDEFFATQDAKRIIGEFFATQDAKRTDKK